MKVILEWAISGVARRDVVGLLLLLSVARGVVGLGMGGRLSMRSCGFVGFAKLSLHLVKTNELLDKLLVQRGFI